MKVGRYKAVSGGPLMHSVESGDVVVPLTFKSDGRQQLLTLVGNMLNI
jgi:hypothetical protein